MISDKWYAQLSLLHVFISEILDVSFQPIIFAAHCWEYQNWNNLLSVSLWSQVKITDRDCVHTTNEIQGQQKYWFRYSTASK
jgi:hypothetical protein